MISILTVNAGSSSIKYKLYEYRDQGLAAILSGLIEGIGESKGAWRHVFNQEDSSAIQFANHLQAFEALTQRLQTEIPDLHIDIIGHRVVHGGELFWQPTLITEEVLTAIEALSALAPLHNPINCLGIRAAQASYPKAAQVAIFDTGFHHSLPDYVYTYPIDLETCQTLGIRRYGFHGINHHYVSLRAAEFLNLDKQQINLISLHLGNGASSCLVLNGQSFDTSMGMTPLAGLMMGTRCGDIDPAIPIFLQQQGYSLSQVDELLNKKSGLKGIAKDNDMRRVTARAAEGDQDAELAIKIYCYRLQTTICHYLGQCPRLDALVFTGGIGENASLIRAKAIENLGHLGFKLDSALNQKSSQDSCRLISQSGIPILVIRGDEELMIAEQSLAAMMSSDFRLQQHTDSVLPRPPIG